MDKPIQLFDFNNNNVRTFLDENGNVWFCLSDICKILDLTTPAKVLSRLDQDGVNYIHTIDSMNRKQNTNFINESNLYRVILQSRKPVAKDLDKWIFNEVIPNIRQKGYHVEKNLSGMEYAKMMLELSKNLVKMEEDKLKLEKENKVLLPKAEIYDDFLESINTISVRELAKLLCKNGYNTGEKRLFKFLREQKILMPNNQPYQEYIDRGYFETRPYTIKHTEYKETVSQTMVTKKGCIYIRKVFKEHYNK